MYRERKKEKIKIEFDASKIKCINEATKKIINTGDKILEGVNLNFKALHDNEPLFWRFGSYFEVGTIKTVYKGYSKGGVIKVSYAK